MLFNIPLVIWMGIITAIALFITFGLGIAMTNYRKPVRKYHIFFAFVTAALAIIHAILAFLFWKYGIAV